MRQKTYSIVVILIFGICLFLYSKLFKTSLSFQDLRTSVNVSDIKQYKYNPKSAYSFFYDTYINNPANLELYLRLNLKASVVNTDDLLLMYKKLLLIRPTWPYYHSGLVQLDTILKNYNPKNIDNAMRHGKHERTVVFGLAEVLFHDWENITESNRLKILNHLSEQHNLLIPQTINISSNFAKQYQYCDFLYEKNNVEYAACKQNYWQPLSE